MTRAELAAASDLLEEAAAATDGEASERLATAADDYARAAEADRGPDHGWLARHRQKLLGLRDEVDEAAASHIEEAIALADEYREGVAGV